MEFFRSELFGKLKKFLGIIVTSVAVIVGLFSDTISLSEKVTLREFGIVISLPVFSVEFQNLASVRIILPPLWLMWVVISVLMYKAIRSDYTTAIYIANNVYEDDSARLDYYYFYPSKPSDTNVHIFPLLSFFTIMLTLLVVKLVFSISVVWLLFVFILLIAVVRWWLIKVFRDRFLTRVQKHRAAMEYLSDVAND